MNFSSMGLPIHGSQNINHIRLIYNKFNYVKTRYDFLLSLLRHSPRQNYFSKKKQRAFNSSSKHHHSYRNSHKPSLSLPLNSSFSSRSSHKRKLKKAFPILSNMPFIHLNSSLIFVNNSPFALTDRRFGIFHHHSSSISYY
jgi:hypothetical protein